MKTFSTLMMTLALMVGFTQSAAADDDLHGAWTVVKMDEERPPGTMTMTFNEDGTLMMSMEIGADQPPFTMSGTYSVDDGKITIAMPADTDAETVDYEIDGDSLVMTGTDEDGVSHRIEMERAAAE